MRIRTVVTLGLLLAAVPAWGVSVDWVPIGEPGNACDVQTQGCFGSVATAYKIGAVEVSNAQYTEFLNAIAASDTIGLYHPLMATFGGITRSGSPGSYSYTTNVGQEDEPVGIVSWYDAARFANWLHNGQPVGVQDATTTEDGAYTLLGGTPAGVPRNPGAQVFLPTEDEWFKAAYYDPDLDLYYDYPTGSDIETDCVTPVGDTGNAANCDNANGGAVTDGGAYALSPSASGTFDQGGNVWEWNETLIGGTLRGIRGGASQNTPLNLKASTQSQNVPTQEATSIGFRVAALTACSDGIDNDGDGRTDFTSFTDCLHPFTPTGDCGCQSAADDSERDETASFPCDDGVDNDSDGRSDFDPVTRADSPTYTAGVGDPGCEGPTWPQEDSQCQDGINNDPIADPPPTELIDFDGGQSIHGPCTGGPGSCPPGVSDPNGDGIADPAPRCNPDPATFTPWAKEKDGCGLGFELALVLPLLMGLRRRARSRRI